jgi:hypothetical protein
LNATVLEDDEDDINSFDLNLPLDEFGAVDFDFVENNIGKLNCTTLLFLERWPFERENVNCICAAFYCFASLASLRTRVCFARLASLLRSSSPVSHGTLPTSSTRVCF